MSRTLLRRLGSGALAALALLSCRDGTTAPGFPRRVTIPLAPRFQAGAEGALPTNRIRVAAYRALDVEGVELESLPLATRTVDVSATAAQWSVDLDVPVSGDSALVVATVELLNVAGGGGTSVEWSGRTFPVVVVPGEEAPVEDVPLGRGGLANLDVGTVAIDLDQVTLAIVVGDSTDWTATLSPPVAGATVLWGTLDPSIASVSPSGRIRGLALGRATITATSGFAADSLFISVVTPAATVASLTVAAGNNQSTTVNTPVPTPPRVVARTASGAPVAGVAVAFFITGGGGNLGGGQTTVTVTTAADGSAQVPTWILGTIAGTNTLGANVTGTNASTSVTATGVAGFPQNVTIVSGDQQQGTAGIALSAPLVARVRDQFGNIVIGAVVTFASPQSGLFQPVTTLSNGQGLVQSTWTPSFSTSTQTATATASGAPIAATFTAFVFIPPR
jgi:hypothetical protein